MPKTKNKNGEASKTKKEKSKLQFTHGALPVKQPSTIEELLGNTGKTKYRYLDDPFSVDEYTKYLNNLQPTDLESHAAEFGLLGDITETSGRQRLKNKLIHEFQLHASRFRAPSNQTIDLEKVMNQDVDIKTIMSRGR